MGEVASQTFSTFGVGVLCIAFAIMALAVFFTGFRRLTEREHEPAPEPLAVRGVLTENTLATVHLNQNRTFERVRFLGFTRSDQSKFHLPYDLDGMAILEDEGGTRYLVRAKDIRMIVVAPEGNGGDTKSA